MLPSYGFKGIGLVSGTPEVVLQAWRVVLLQDGGVHFAGFNPAVGTTSVSSRVIDFNPRTLVGRTESGRIYRFIRSAVPVDAQQYEEVSRGLNVWLMRFCQSDWLDITAELMSVVETENVPQA
jgi:endonuclease V-like protein UPF0215 family